MKRKRIVFLHELLVTQFNHWCFFPLFALVAATVAGFTGQELTPGVYFWPILGLFPLICFLLRNYTKNIFLLLVQHIILIGLIWILPVEMLVLKICYMAAALIYTVHSLVLWLMSGSPEDGTVVAPVTVVIAIGSLYILHYQKLEGWNSFFIVSLIGTLGVYLLIYYVSQYLNFLVVNDSSAGHIPEREIFFSGMGMVMGYTFIGMLILLLSANVEWMRGILAVLKQGLRLLFRLIAMLFPDGGKEIPLPQEVPASESSGEMFLPEPAEPALFWVVLERVVMLLAVVAFVILLYKLTRRLVRFLREHIHRQLGIKAKEQASVMDVREKCDIQRRTTHRSRKDFRLFPSAARRIRQLYRKRTIASVHQLTSSGSREDLKNMTAAECAAILSARNMADIYEKARYSNESCEAEDIKQMKDACRL